MNYQHYWETGINHDTYNQQFQQKADKPEDWEYGQYIPLNFSRSQRLNKTFKLKPEEIHLLKKAKKQLWIVISEHWCGDASQIVPVMRKMSESSNGQIEMRLILRDDYPELIESHLTNGSKSVPKIIQLDPNFHLINDWGPRPVEAQQIVNDWKKDPNAKPHYAETLHKWYAMDKQQRITSELLNFIDY